MNAACYGTVRRQICPFTDNVGEATIDGAEVELTARLSEQLTLRASGSYNDAEISAAAANTSAEIGDTLQDAPRWTFALLAGYRHPLADRLALVADAGYQYSSSVFGSFDIDSPDYRRDGYGLLNARAATDVRPYLRAEVLAHERRSHGCSASCSGLEATWGSDGGTRC